MTGWATITCGSCSKSGNDRAIGGASSGAICAFTAAWERPDAFSRVFSAIGTYVGLRGGNDYPTWIRKYEPKPIRIFLEDGENDLNIYGGDWWMANQEMERALRFAGYEVEHSWGTGGHDTKHATEIFPDAMRFLWKGWPEAVKAGAGSAQLREIVEEGSGWEKAVEAEQNVRGLYATPDGSIVYRTVNIEEIISERVPRSGADPFKLHRIAPDGTPEGEIETTIARGLLAFGPDGRAYSSSEKEGVVVCALDGSGRSAVFPRHATMMLVLDDGTVLLRAERREALGPDDLVTIRPGEAAKVHEFPIRATSPLAATLSPDRSLLYSMNWFSLASQDLEIASTMLGPNGEPLFTQAFFRVEPTEGRSSRGSDLIVDRDGRLYCLTTTAVQVFDQAGRVNVVLPLPYQRPETDEKDANRVFLLTAIGVVSGPVFGGPDHDILYAAKGRTIYKRQMKVSGAPAFLPPSKPKAPRL